MMRSAVLVSTRNRRQEIADWLAAMKGHSADCVIVVDNNDVSDHEWITAQALNVGIDIIYEHCTIVGYSSPRNVGIEIAIRNSIDILILLDDDDKPPSNIVDKHLQAMAFHDADVVTGYSKHNRPEGQPVETAATRNVSLKRWILDKGVRFDEQLNLTGSEDVEFFRDARELGARIVFSHLPKLASSCEPPRPQTAIEVSLYGAAKSQNKLYVQRVRHGLWSALRMYLAKYMLRLPAGLLLLALGRTLFIRKLIVNGETLILSHSHAWRGLQGYGLSRPALKMGRLEEIPRAR